MDYIESILLGIVQGLTEFLPISSSGHLEIFKEIFFKNKQSFRRRKYTFYHCSTYCNSF